MLSNGSGETHLAHLRGPYSGLFLASDTNSPETSFFFEIAHPVIDAIALRIDTILEDIVALIPASLFQEASEEFVIA